MTKMWDELVSVSGIIKKKTDKAILLFDEELSSEVWLPISQIETGDDLIIGAEVDIIIPEWLARDKGLT